MNLVFDIPFDLFAGLQHFIDVKTLSFFDVAVCNRIKREIFLDNLDNCSRNSKVGIYDGPEAHLVSEQFLGWVCLRNISLRSLILNNSFIARVEYSTKVSRHFQMLNYNKCLQRVFKKLVSIHFKGCYYYFAIKLGHLIVLSSELTHLTLSHASGFLVQFFHEISLHSCQKLESFDFTVTTFDNVACAKFCENLKSRPFTFIRTSYTDVDKNGIDPAILASFKSLKHLSISWTSVIPESCVRLLSNCHKLTTLDLASQGAVHMIAMLAVLERCKLITDLNIGGCESLLNSSFIESLSGSGLKLKRLIMNGGLITTHISSKSYELLFTKMIDISQLDISYLRIDLDILHLIVVNLELRWIQFHKLGIDDESVYNILCSGFKELYTFDTLNSVLSGSPVPRESGAIYNPLDLVYVVIPIKDLLMSKSTTLNDVRLSSNIPKVFGAYNLGPMINDFAMLTTLSLSKVTDVGLKSIHCISLQSIALYNCITVTDDAVISFLKLNKRCLTSLTIMKSPLLSDGFLESLGYNCKRLKYLELLGCNMTTRQLKLSVKRFHRLTELKFDYEEVMDLHSSFHLRMDLIRICDVLGYMDLRQRNGVIDLTHLLD